MPWSEYLAVRIVVSDKEILGQTLLSRQTCLSNDIAVDERFPESRILRDELGFRSILSVPLLTETTIHGVFFLGSPDTGGFTPLKADILALFANQATIAIHNNCAVRCYWNSVIAFFRRSRA